MMQMVILFLEFFKIGLFSIGGGLATLPFMYDLAEKYDWLPMEQIPDMIAVAEATPGPLGVNMAVYAGFQCAGVVGSTIATAGLVAPSIIVIILVYLFLEKFRQSKTVDWVFYGLRPVVVGLIASAGFGVMVMALFSMDAIGAQGRIDWALLLRWKEWILFLVVLLAARKWKEMHPVVWIAIGAAAGIIFHMA